MFNKYPYTDFHEMNLDWVIAKVKDLMHEVDTFKVVNAITWGGLHSPSKEYATWTIVDTPEHNGYISIKPVPVGVTVDNVDYWVLVADYSALYASVQTSIDSINNTVSAIETKLTNMHLINVKDFGATGDGTNDTAAFNNAIASMKDYETLYIPAGVYKISSVAVNKCISIIGDNAFIEPVSDHTSIFVFDCDIKQHYFTKIEGITFDSGNTTDCSGIQITSANDANNFFSNNMIHECSFRGLNRGIYINKTPDSTKEIHFDWNTISDCTFRSCKYGVDFITGSGTGNLLNSNTFICSNVGIRYISLDGNAGNIGDIIITSSHFGGSGTGVAIDATNASYCERYIVNTCQFDAGLSYSVSVINSHSFKLTDISYGGATNILISNNCYNYTVDYPIVTDKQITYVGDAAANTLTGVAKIGIADNMFNVGSCKFEILAEVKDSVTKCAYVRGIYSKDDASVTILESRNADGSGGVQIIANNESAKQIGVYIKTSAASKCIVTTKCIGFSTNASLS